MTRGNSFPQISSSELILGAPFTGKSTMLMQRVASALNKGVSPDDVLVLCATTTAAQDFKRRMVATHPQTGGVQVVCAREHFLDILGSEHAQQFTGRGTTLLLPFEYDFLLEDLKTTGTRPARLREILKFFYRGLVSLDTDDPDWLISNEEHEIMGMLRDCLKFEGGMLEHEIPGLTADYLRQAEGAKDMWQRRCVFVDDFNCQPRAAQVAACLLAGEQVVIAADPEVAVRAQDIWPCVEGVTEFQENNPDACVTKLGVNYSCGASAQALRALREKKGADVLGLEFAPYGEDSYTLIDGETPEDEVAALSARVKQLVDEGVCADDIVVAAAAPSWRRRVLLGLQQQGLAAKTQVEATFLKCDVRYNEANYVARFVTLLALVANGNDGVAWRSWCGFGDYLANSNGFKGIREAALHENKDIVKALEPADLQQSALSSLDGLASAARIVHARDDARARIAALQGHSGEKLLAAIAQNLTGDASKVPAPVRALVISGQGENDAVSMIGRLKRVLLHSTFEGDGFVRVVPLENVAGLAPKYLFVAGFMNGLFPKADFFDGTKLTNEQVERRESEDLGFIASVLAKASEGLIVTYAKRLPLEYAERQRVLIDKIVVDEGKRVALTQASVYLPEL